jgi:hypothetical protein
MMRMMQTLEEKEYKIQNYTDTMRLEHFKHASLFSIEKSICASPSSRIQLFRRGKNTQ